jgi:predicted DNA binding CopG/RHH family protein
VENLNLTEEEQKLLASVENDEWISVAHLNQDVERYQAYAQEQLGELQEVKIQILSQDLEALKHLADQADLPLSIMIADILHQFSMQKISINEGN